MRSGDSDRDDERRLDVTQVPEPLWWLIPFAQRWGIGDDVERSVAVDTADDAEVVDLVRAGDAANDDVLYESTNPP